MVDEMDPWKNYVPPQTVPRRDIYKETFDRVAAKKARDSRESFFGRYGLSMVVVGAWTLASYTVSFELFSRWRASWDWEGREE